MLKIIISGCSGHMGRVVESICTADPAVQVAAGFDVLGSSDREFPVYSSPSQFTGEADAVIDFSSPAALNGLLDFAQATGTPLVLATTGYTPEQVAQIGAAAQKGPIFRSANMSLGINVLLELVKKAASVLGDSYDIEIVERHHRRKVDAPSGTAKLLLEAVDPQHRLRPVYGREGNCGRREKDEVGIHALRGGTVAGTHTVHFFGPDEELELTHRAASRQIFVNGALHIARLLPGRPKGVYDLQKILFGA